ncbi:putative aldehyde dehydrogenase [Rhodovulum sulfidophilum]|uniref:Putative aldehyde dehydrogenase n=1 Tax=Rhodovulum sulfidophilum TaxID=35806 RepID=A0A0D6AYQ8_RHOSU|nr:putative aldehyde dehydrogenase [Rhodovulum sulfidophilum]
MLRDARKTASVKLRRGVVTKSKVGNLPIAAVRSPKPDPAADHGSGRSSPLRHALEPPRSGERDEAAVLAANSHVRFRSFEGKQSGTGFGGTKALGKLMTARLVLVCRSVNT